MKTAPCSYPRGILRTGWWCAAFAAALRATTAGAGVDVIATPGRNLYRIATAELDGRSTAREIVGATYAGRVGAFLADGQPLWDSPAASFVFDLAAGDLLVLLVAERPIAMLRLFETRLSPTVGFSLREHRALSPMFPTTP